MKRREFIDRTWKPVLFGILVPQYAIAAQGNRRLLMNVPVVAAGGGACDTQRDQKTGATNSGLTLDGGITRYASTFTAAGSYTICKATLRLSKAGTPPGTMKCGIYSTSAGTPNTLVGSYSDTQNCTAAPATEGDITFVNMSAGLTGSTAYHCVVEVSTTGDGSNRLIWYYYDVASHTIHYYDGSWTSLLTAQSFKFTLYST